MALPWEDEFVTRAKAYTALDNLIDGRVRPVILGPEDPLPGITYRWVNVRPTQPLFMGDSTDVRGELHITAWGEDYDEAKEVAEQVTAALNRWPVRIAGYTGAFQDIYLLGYGDREYEDGTEEYARDLVFQVEATGSLMTPSP